MFGLLPGSLLKGWLSCGQPCHRGGTGDALESSQAMTDEVVEGLKKGAEAFTAGFAG